MYIQVDWVPTGTPTVRTKTKLYGSWREQKLNLGNTDGTEPELDN